MSEYKTHKFPRSRIATVDVCSIGKLKHHIPAMIEIDVTLSREKIKKYKKENGRISFTAWLIKAICHTIHEHSMVAAYPRGRRSVVLFDDINVSFLVEKEIDRQRVPMPLLIPKANERSIESITGQLEESKRAPLTGKEVVLRRATTRAERLYFMLPGFLRRSVWKFLLKRPVPVFNRMGNVAITSIGMMGKVNGWFIPISVHPICFGIGSIVKKAAVIDDAILIREIMHMTVLIDHDVIDGAPMARFISDLSKNLEKGIFL